MKYYLAIDIGASSGRHIIGFKENNEIKMVEIYRFNDYLLEDNGNLIWDIKKILVEVKIGIRLAIKKYPNIVSMSIDTWGCDYVLMNNDKEIYPCYSYRDSRTKSSINLVHKIIPFDELYKITGTQYQPFNTIYQLYSDKITGRLDNATDFLMIPEYLFYKLTGVKVKEYTNASTTGLTSLSTLSFSNDIINRLGFNPELFKDLKKSGTVACHFTSEVAKELGCNIKMVLSSTHDTASAVKGIDIPKDTPYLSSGTWSLLGVKSDIPYNGELAKNSNYSNEYGDDYFRFQKNIMGMWIVNNLSKSYNYSIDKMIKLSKLSTFPGIYDVNDEMFLSSLDIVSSIDQWFTSHNLDKPTSEMDYIHATFNSLAYSYKQALDELELITLKKYDKMYIIGGGARNTYLNELTEEYCGKKIIALPIEATALGNIKSQMEAE